MWVGKLICCRQFRTVLNSLCFEMHCLATDRPPLCYSYPLLPTVQHHLNCSHTEGVWIKQFSQNQQNGYCMFLYLVHIRECVYWPSLFKIDRSWLRIIWKRKYGKYVSQWKQSYFLSNVWHTSLNKPFSQCSHHLLDFQNLSLIYFLRYWILIYIIKRKSHLNLRTILLKSSWFILVFMRPFFF